MVSQTSDIAGFLQQKPATSSSTAPCWTGTAPPSTPLRISRLRGIAQATDEQDAPGRPVPDEEHEGVVRPELRRQRYVVDDNGGRAGRLGPLLVDVHEGLVDH